MAMQMRMDMKLIILIRMSNINTDLLNSISILNKLLIYNFRYDDETNYENKLTKMLDEDLQNRDLDK